MRKKGRGQSKMTWKRKLEVHIDKEKEVKYILDWKRKINIIPPLHKHHYATDRTK